MPAIGTSAIATPGQAAGQGGLFAAILALLAPGATSTTPTETTLPGAIAAPLRQGLAQAKDLLPGDTGARLAATMGLPQLAAAAGQLEIDISGDDLAEAVTVGFAPAAMPANRAVAAATPRQPAGQGGLIATVRALLAPATTSPSPTEPILPGAIAAPLRQGLAQATDLDPKELEARLAAAAEQLGIDISDLGDLSGGLDTATAAPVDPAAFTDAVTDLVEALAALTDAPADIEVAETPEADDLEAAADALLAVIGAAPPATLPTPPPTTGDTFTELVATITDALTGPTPPASAAPSAPIIPTPADDGGTADVAKPTETGVEAASATDVPALEVERAPVGERPTKVPNDHAPLVERLTQLLDDTAKAMAASDPRLAEKLAALARTLPTLPDEVLTALATATKAEADEAAPELASLINHIERPRPAQRAAAAPVFTAPTLELPVRDTDAGLAPQTAPAALSKAPAPSSAEAESAPALPGIARLDAPAPQEHQPKPAVAPAEAGSYTPADPSPAAAAQPAPATAPAALRVVQAAYQQATTMINLPQVAFEIVRQVEAGNSRFQIRLDPAELGRIDVQLDVDRSGNVNARLTVERPETLDLMQRDQRALQQALQQAGLDTSRTSLEFSLRQNPFSGEGSTGGRNQGQSGRQTGDPTVGEAGSEAMPELYRGHAAVGALNLFV